MKLLRARLVLPISSPPIEDGFVRVEGELITDFGPWSDDLGEAENLGDVILMPGLINAHCHLDYTVMRGAILRQPDFPSWVRRINELKRTLTDDDNLASIAKGFEELKVWGTTSVFNIEAFPELMVRMPVPPIRTWWFYELIDIRNRIHTDDVVAGALSFFESRPGWLGGFGLSPHAPYTASAKLYELTCFASEKYSMPWTTHLAETDEEFELFMRASGPLHDFLKKLGRDMSDTGGVTPTGRMLTNGLVPHGGILAHMNCLAESDYALLAERKADIHVVHCPNCHAYFERPRFELERLLEIGIPVSLGTDSLASNKSLNLFDEMRQLHRTHPAVSAKDAVEMITLTPARAIGLPGKLGEISKGALADLIAVPYTGPAEDVYEAVRANREKITWMLVNGQST